MQLLHDKELLNKFDLKIEFIKYLKTSFGGVEATQKQNMMTLITII